jgi:hypothetical protein
MENFGKVKNISWIEFLSSQIFHHPSPKRNLMCLLHLLCLGIYIDFVFNNFEEMNPPNYF